MFKRITKTTGEFAFFKINFFYQSNSISTSRYFIIQFLQNNYMGLFFWDFSDCNDIARQWIMFGVNILVLIFVIRAVYKTWMFYRRCIFQLVPLSVNLGASFVLLLLKLFEKGYQYDEIGHLIQIFAYFLFCHTFALMYSKIFPSAHSQLRKKVWNIIIFVLILFVIGIAILIFSGIISNKCQQKTTEELPTIISLVFQFITFLPTSFYGFKILKNLRQKQKQTDQSQTDEDLLNSFRSSKEQYIIERRKQIMLVLIAYFSSLIVRLIITIVTVVDYDQLFMCDQVQTGVYIISSDLLMGQIILILGQLDQLLPHIVIPIAMYVIPLKRIDATLIKLDEKQPYDQDDEDEQSKKEDQAQEKINTMLSSRLSGKNN